MNENQYHSIYPAIVKDNKDPKFLGRVKLLVPAISQEFTTEWAFPVSKITGIGFGEYNPPEEESGCWVMFLEGDPEVPVYLGGYYAEPDGEPETPEEFKREVPTNRGWKTKSGHLVEFDDLEDSQGIRFTSATGFKTVLDDKNQILCLETPAGQKFCLDDQNELVTLTATGDVVETIGKNKDVNITENYTVNVTGDEEHNAENFKVNANSDATIEATGNAKLSGTGQTEVGSAASTTLVNGQTVLIAGGGAPVAVVGGKAIGQGNLGAPVVSTIVQGSSKVLAPL